MIDSPGAKNHFQEPAGAGDGALAQQLLSAAGEVGLRSHCRFVLCTNPHPLCTRFANTFGSSTSEASTRPGPTFHC
jgi:hypothetical protein